MNTTTTNETNDRAHRVGVVLMVPVLALVAAVLAVIVLTGQSTTVRLYGGDEGTLTPAWQCLLDDGYRGVWDGDTALYPSKLDALLCGASSTEGIGT